jgi:hypothetical protein
VNDPRDTLQLLSVIHYAVGAMMAMVATAPMVLGMVGAAMAEPGSDEAIRTEGARVADALGVGCVVAILVAGLLFGFLTIWAGGSLAKTRRYRFCLSMAAIESFFFPFGTALGIVTITQLLKPEVKALFAPPA